MGKVGKIVPPDKMAIAEKNKIPRTTLYNRLRAGWDIEEAITKPSQQRGGKRKRDSEGTFIGVGKGKPRAFTLPKEWDEKLDKAIADSDLNQSEFLEKIVINKLKRMKL